MPHNLPHDEIHVAAEHGDLDKVKKLYEKDPTIIYRPHSQYGTSPIFWAIKNGKDDVVKWLVSVNADLLLETAVGYAPLGCVTVGTPLELYLIERTSDLLKSKRSSISSDKYISILISVLIQKNELKKAKSELDAAQAELADIKSLVLACAANKLGNIFYDQKNYFDAEACDKLALKYFPLTEKAARCAAYARLIRNYAAQIKIENNTALKAELIVKAKAELEVVQAEIPDEKNSVLGCAINSLGVVLDYQKEYVEAQACSKLALKYVPLTEKANRGSVYGNIMMGYIAQAEIEKNADLKLELIKKAKIELDTAQVELPSVHSLSLGFAIDQLGNVYFSQREYSKAQVCYKLALKYFPLTEKVRRCKTYENILATYLAEAEIQNNTDLKLDLIITAKTELYNVQAELPDEKSSRLGHAILKLGANFYSQEKYKEAQECYKQALKYLPLTEKALRCEAYGGLINNYVVQAKIGKNEALNRDLLITAKAELNAAQAELVDIRSAVLGRAINSLARASYFQGEYIETQAYAKLALEHFLLTVKSDCFQAYANLINGYLGQSRAKNNAALKIDILIKAKAELDVFQAELPDEKSLDFGHALNTLGVAFFHLERYQDAQICAKLALKYLPLSERSLRCAAYANLIEDYQRQAEVENVIALKIDIIKKAKVELEAAQAEFVDVIDERLGYVIKTLGSVFYSLGEYIEAQNCAKLALKYLPVTNMYLRCSAYVNLIESLRGQAEVENNPALRIDLIIKVKAELSAVQADLPNQENVFLGRAISTLENVFYSQENYLEAQDCVKLALKYLPLGEVADRCTAYANLIKNYLGQAAIENNAALKVDILIKAKAELDAVQTEILDEKNLVLGDAISELGAVLYSQEKYSDAQSCAKLALKYLPLTEEARRRVVCENLIQYYLHQAEVENNAAINVFSTGEIRAQLETAQARIPAKIEKDTAPQIISIIKANAELKAVLAELPVPDGVSLNRGCALKNLGTVFYSQKRYIDTKICAKLALKYLPLTEKALRCAVYANLIKSYLRQAEIVNDAVLKNALLMEAKTKADSSVLEFLDYENAEFSDACYMLANVFHKKEKYEDAQVLYQHASRLNSKRGDVHIYALLDLHRLNQLPIVGVSQVCDLFENILKNHSEDSSIKPYLKLLKLVIKKISDCADQVGLNSSENSLIFEKANILLDILSQYFRLLDKYFFDRFDFFVGALASLKSLWKLPEEIHLELFFIQTSANINNSHYVDFELAKFYGSKHKYDGAANVLLRAISKLLPQDLENASCGISQLSRIYAKKRECNMGIALKVLQRFIDNFLSKSIGKKQALDFLSQFNFAASLPDLTVASYFLKIALHVMTFFANKQLAESELGIYFMRKKNREYFSALCNSHLNILKVSSLSELSLRRAVLVLLDKQDQQENNIQALSQELSDLKKQMAKLSDEKSNSIKFNFDENEKNVAKNFQNNSKQMESSLLLFGVSKKRKIKNMDDISDLTQEENNDQTNFECSDAKKMKMTGQK